MSDLPPQVRAVVEAARAALSACRMVNVRTLGALEELEALDDLESALEALSSAPPPEPLPMAVKELEHEASRAEWDAGHFQRIGMPERASEEAETARQCREAVRRLSCRA